MDGVSASVRSHHRMVLCTRTRIELRVVDSLCGVCQSLIWVTTSLKPPMLTEGLMMHWLSGGLQAVVLGTFMSLPWPRCWSCHKYVHSRPQ
jgi:hypothetical protein